MTLWLPLALRDLKGSLGRFLAFLLIMVLAIATMSLSGITSATLRNGLTENGAKILGGDVELSFTYRDATKEELHAIENMAQTLSKTYDFRSMAKFKDQQSLTEVKAVDAAYPLLGEVLIEPPQTLPDALSNNGMIIEKHLLAKIGAKIGDKIQLGGIDVTLTGVIADIPDALSSGFSFGPRSLVSIETLKNSKLIGEGSFFKSKYKLLLKPELTIRDAKTKASPLIHKNGATWRDAQNAAGSLNRNIDRLGSFLDIIGFVSLALGGIALSAATRDHLARKTKTIAILKTIGIPPKAILFIYSFQIGLIALIGILLGLILGGSIAKIALGYLADFMPLGEMAFLLPCLTSALAGALIVIAATSLPLLRSAEIKPARIFQSTPTQELNTRSKRLIPLLSLLFLVILLFVTSERYKTTLFMLLAFGGALIALSLLHHFVMKGLRKLNPDALLPRLILHMLTRTPRDTRIMTLGLGLGLSLMIMVFQIGNTLRASLQEGLPETAPAFFLIDIQKDQLEPLKEKLSAIGATDITSAPMLRGIITEINGKPARDVAGSHWALRGDRGLSFSHTPPKNSPIVEGKWWTKDYQGPPLVSFSAEEAKELGLSLGDKITLNVLGRSISLEIANFRALDFRNLEINFLMIATPSSFAGAPFTSIATFSADPSLEDQILSLLGADFPNITAIPVRETAERISKTVTQFTLALVAATTIIIVSGLCLSLTLIYTGKDKRIAELSILRILGASEWILKTTYVATYAAIGFLAGFFSAFIGSILSALSLFYLFENASISLSPTALFLPLSIAILIGLIATITGRSISVRKMTKILYET